MPKLKKAGPISPHDAVAKATASPSTRNLRLRGKKSGVSVPAAKNDKAGFENDEDFFSQARSPEKSVADENSRTTRSSATKKPKTNKPASNDGRKPRFSIEGQPKQQPETDQKSRAVRMGKGISKVLNSVKDGEVSISPSDLSMVTTAPQTPASVAVAAVENETPVVTQENSINDSQLSMQSSAQESSKDENDHNLRDDTQDAEMAAEEDKANNEDPSMPFSDIDDDDGDDLVPPPPQEEPEYTQQEEQDEEETRENDADQSAEEKIEEPDEGFPLTEDDYDDDEKEGEGFQLSSEQEDGTTNVAGSQANDEDTDDEEKKEEDLSAHNQYAGSRKQSHSDLPTPKNDNNTIEHDDVEDDDNQGDGLNLDDEDGDDKEGDGFNMATNSGDEDEDEGVKDQESDGFNMVHDPETPDSVREERLRADEEQRKQERKKKKKHQKRPPILKDDLSDIDSTPAKSGKKRNKKKKVRIHESAFALPKGIPAGPRAYEVLPIDQYKKETELEDGRRRSQRARYEPLQYWRNERPIYGATEEEGLLGEAMGNMPEIKQIVRAQPTPMKERTITVKKSSKGKAAKSKRKRRDDDSVDSEDTPFDDRKLKRKYTYVEGENALVWNDTTQQAVERKVVSYSKNLVRQDLPLPKNRKSSEGQVVGRAAQAFNVGNEGNDNYVGFIMGQLALPPKGIKDAESSGSCAHTFTVCICQPNSLEVLYGDPDEGDVDPATAQRFLLGPGDQFVVPQGNSYKIQNHSATHECMLTWTIIKPRTAGSS